MTENVRGRSSETKFGRVPLWLYDTGVGLQAIATYGWLHGRYGHYERVMPSYGTLAKELGVSRGSVIAYVKALTSVGAVRIETSGAAGRQTNVYAIAFAEPSRWVVSILTTPVRMLTRWSADWTTPVSPLV